MKIILTLLLLFCTLNLAFSQSKRKIHLSFTTHTPIVADGLGKFYNNDWFLNEAQQSTGARKTFSIGTQVKYSIQENYAIKLNFSYTSRSLASSYQHRIANGIDSIVIQSNFSYQQDIFNTSIGFEYQFDLHRLWF